MWRLVTSVNIWDAVLKYSDTATLFVVVLWWFQMYSRYFRGHNANCGRLRMTSFNIKNFIPVAVCFSFCVVNNDYFIQPHDPLVLIMLALCVFGDTWTRLLNTICMNVTHEWVVARLFADLFVYLLLHYVFSASSCVASCTVVWKWCGEMLVESEVMFSLHTPWVEV